jgi:hypothetical protein
VTMNEENIKRKLIDKLRFYYVLHGLKREDWVKIDCLSCKNRGGGHFDKDTSEYIGECGKKCYEWDIDLGTFEYNERPPSPNRNVYRFWISICPEWEPEKND